MKNASVPNLDEEAQFIVLRAQGRSYLSIAADMKISKGKALEMGKRLNLQVGLEAALFRQVLLERYKVAANSRAAAYAEVMGAALDEIHRRITGEGAGLAALKFPELLALAQAVEVRLQAEEQPVQITTGWADTMGDEITAQYLTMR